MAATGQYNPYGMVWFFQTMNEMYGPGQDCWLLSPRSTQARITDLQHHFSEPPRFGKYKDTKQKEAVYW